MAIKVGTKDADFPYKKIMLGSTQVWGTESGYTWNDFHDFLVYCQNNITTYNNSYMKNIITTLVNNWDTINSQLQEQSINMSEYNNFWIYPSGRSNNVPNVCFTKQNFSYICKDTGAWEIPNSVDYYYFSWEYGSAGGFGNSTTGQNYSKNTVGLFSSEPTNGEYYTCQLQNIWEE